MADTTKDKLGAGYADLDPLVASDLVAANHILAENGVLDSFGHVSVRDPRNPNRYLQMQAMAPRDVSVANIITFDLDSNPIDANGRSPYRERFIHGQIYKARPDVNAVVHSHSPTIIPFSVTEKPLRAIFHNGHFLGQGMPVWEISEHAGVQNNMLVLTNELGQSLAQALGKGSVILMRGHGNAVAALDLKTAVFRAIYTEVNAKLQMQAVMLGGPINFLNEFEVLKAQNVDRPWATWKKQVGSAVIPYLQRIRTYYAALGYGAPYEWAHYAHVPFHPLAQTAVAMPDRARHHGGALSARQRRSGAGRALQCRGEILHRLFRLTRRRTTTCASRTSPSTASTPPPRIPARYFPLAALRDAAARGRIGSVARALSWPADQSQPARHPRNRLPGAPRALQGRRRRRGDPRAQLPGLPSEREPRRTHAGRERHRHRGHGLRQGHRRACRRAAPAVLRLPARQRRGPPARSAVAGVHP